MHIFIGLHWVGPMILSPYLMPLGARPYSRKDLKWPPSGLNWPRATYIEGLASGSDSDNGYETDCHSRLILDPHFYPILTSHSSESRTSFRSLPAPHGNFVSSNSTMHLRWISYILSHWSREFEVLATYDREDEVQAVAVYQLSGVHTYKPFWILHSKDASHRNDLKLKISISNKYELPRTQLFTFFNWLGLGLHLNGNYFTAMGPRCVFQSWAKKGEDERVKNKARNKIASSIVLGKVDEVASFKSMILTSSTRKNRKIRSLNSSVGLSVFVCGYLPVCLVIITSKIKMKWPK